MAVKEEETDYWQKILQSAKRLRIEVAIVFLAFLFVIIGIYLLKSSPQDQELVVIDAQGQGDGEIVVDISGAVEKPGVYKFKDGTRMSEAIETAGGFSKSADYDWVSRTFNLASKISDAAKIYIPEKGEKVTQILGTKAGTVNINSASSGDLDTLTGVGPVTAQEIIDGRPYSKIEDLVSKKVLTQSAFDKISGQISVF